MLIENLKTYKLGAIKSEAIVWKSTEAECPENLYLLSLIFLPA